MDDVTPGPSRPATSADLYAAMVQADQIVGEQRRRIEELEIAVRAALSFVQQRHADISDGHAQMVIAALRGALRSAVCTRIAPHEDTHS